MKKIEAYEPWVFLFFGMFHAHRIWGLLDREAYADFWVGIMENRGAFYYILMGILAALCLWGIKTFLRHLHDNYWWRWIYIFCGGYLLFDLFAIATGLEVWYELILKMYDVTAWYWNLLWGFFIGMGAFSMGLGICLLYKRNRQCGGK